MHSSVATLFRPRRRLCAVVAVDRGFHSENNMTVSCETGTMALSRPHRRLMRHTSASLYSSRQIISATRTEVQEIPSGRNSSVTVMRQDRGSIAALLPLVHSILHQIASESLHVYPPVCTHMPAVPPPFSCLAFRHVRCSLQTTSATTCGRWRRRGGVRLLRLTCCTCTCRAVHDAGALHGARHVGQHRLHLRRLHDGRHRLVPHLPQPPDAHRCAPPSLEHFSTCYSKSVYQQNDLSRAGSSSPATARCSSARRHPWLVHDSWAWGSRLLSAGCRK